ncbi:conserved hypothetical protein [Vibrio crassostreae]|nr:conserved hypothetical protein [Vibrio chagasii]CAK2873360.1 conserved hypothetical protein [Vibrio crassostreae]
MIYIPINPNQMTFLTNGCCEAVDESMQCLIALGLSVQTEPDFYPLTAAEEVFISEDIVTLADNFLNCNVAYSVLFHNKKYLNLVHAEAFGKGDDESSREIAYENHTKALQKAEKIAAVAGGHVAWQREPDFEYTDGQSSLDGEYTTNILIPFEYAAQFETFEGWKAHLSSFSFDRKYLAETLNKLLPLLTSNQVIDEDFIEEMHEGDVSIKDAINRWLNKQDLTIKPHLFNIHPMYLDFDIDGVKRIRRAKLLVDTDYGIANSIGLSVYYDKSSKGGVAWKGNLVDSLLQAELF